MGAGKTTFLRRYVRYLVQQGHKVCILENDFGAVNVDAMLVQEVLGPGCDVETISGGCDCDTHQRRMRTKLIAMAMRGFDRVVVEPSGIFDVDEFFRYPAGRPAGPVVSAGQRHRHRGRPSAGNAFAAGRVSAGVRDHERRLCAAEPCPAGSARPVRRRRCPPGACTGNRKIFPPLCAGGDPAKDWDALTDADLAALAACGYRQASCEKLHFDQHAAFTSLCFLELHLTPQQLQTAAQRLFAAPECGQVLRVKGFAPAPAGGWLELNATAAGCTLAPIPQGQEVVIVIGEALDKAAIEAKLKGYEN